MVQVRQQAVVRTIHARHLVRDAPDLDAGGRRIRPHTVQIVDKDGLMLTFVEGPVLDADGVPGEERACVTVPPAGPVAPQWLQDVVAEHRDRYGGPAR